MLSGMEPGRQQRRLPGASRWRLLLVLLALFAANTQQLVAQSHWHTTVSALADARVGSTSPDDGAGRHDDCLLCQVAAHTSAAATPPSVQLPPPVLRVFTSAIPAEHRSVVVTRPAHAWQSRGPPAI